MLTPQQFAQALGSVESNNNPNSPLGDGGRAMGQWQVHPDWVWTWATHFSYQPTLGETWDSFIQRLVIRFYEYHVAMPAKLSDVEIAMSFHIGHTMYTSSQDWDPHYAARFEEAVLKL